MILRSFFKKGSYGIDTELGEPGLLILSRIMALLTMEPKIGGTWVRAEEHAYVNGAALRNFECSLIMLHR